jgi:nucleoid DNA-binding protein
MAKKMPAKAKTAAPKKIAPASKPRTKSDIYRTISETTELSRKQVVAVFDTLSAMIAADLSKGTVFGVPGLMKLTVKNKPATKAREGTNPFTGEKMMFKAKPASKQVRIRPMKALKEMVK